jgi:uncharacterized protein (TIGR02246 family)
MPIRTLAAALITVSVGFFVSAAVSAQKDLKVNATEASYGAGVRVLLSVTVARKECRAVLDQQAIESVRHAYLNAVNNGDADTVAALHTENSMSMPAGMPSVVGRESIREIMEASLSAIPPDLQFEFEAKEIRIADGWAVERGITPALGPFPSGKYVTLYEREADGCWRIAWTITNSDAPAPSP